MNRLAFGPYCQGVRLLLALFIGLAWLRYLSWHDTGARDSGRTSGRTSEDPHSKSPKIPPATPMGNNTHELVDCHPLEGIEDIMVVVKTGATEALEKIPVHLRTTLKCIPNFVIFSDFAETIGGIQVHDVLRNVDEPIKQAMPEFDIYNRLRQSGRAGLVPEDMNDSPSTPWGKPDNRGWKLDKWKFLHMIKEIMEMQPDKAWYVFSEGDTYYVWRNLLTLLKQLDPGEPYYIGSPAQIGDTIFAHGGSGIVISHTAMHRLAEHIASHGVELDQYTQSQWAGDCVLGKAFLDVGISLSFAEPMLQGATPWEFWHYGPQNDNHHWCTPVVTYHHMRPADIVEMWRFEQGWREGLNERPMLHAEVFEGLVYPQLGRVRADWDNLSTDENRKGSLSLASCAAHCLRDRNCHQYSYEAGSCRTSQVARRGNSRPGVTSGWQSERIKSKIVELSPCQSINWINI
ncbi:hypothetical protein BDV24DRAFT_169401 [Aspergillus arachidicola]|uniref:N-acetylgalactosaminide beta-1,3-galactosyltransferase n=1 Tax=Aspergillus arachidicola TaxID=656916 RepID=A0A5N6XUI7_9EURO|nr:hypothetical protein BDV24DRAFT_169401 [Aspergillus arachidicola]